MRYYPPVKHDSLPGRSLLDGACDTTVSVIRVQCREGLLGSEQKESSRHKHTRAHKHRQTILLGEGLTMLTPLSHTMVTVPHPARNPARHTVLSSRIGGRAYCHTHSPTTHPLTPGSSPSPNWSVAITGRSVPGGRMDPAVCALESQSGPLVAGECVPP